MAPPQWPGLNHGLQPQGTVGVVRAPPTSGDG